MIINTKIKKPINGIVFKKLMYKVSDFSDSFKKKTPTKAGENYRKNSIVVFFKYWGS